MADTFVHLHNHTDYSMLDGAARIGDLVKHAASLGMPALAITDHGNMFGAKEFHDASRKAGIKPIIGIEAYVTPKVSRFSRERVRWGQGGGDDVSGGGAYTHMTLWAETTEGMHNLFRLSSLASIEGYYFKPRMDEEILQRYAKGVLATTGCPSGEVQTLIRLGKYDEAVASAAKFRDIFGEGNYYLELMDHGIDVERRAKQDLLRLGKDLGLPRIATNDLHYVRQTDSHAHAVLLCVQSGSSMSDPKRFAFDGDSYYLMTAEQMRHQWRELPDACDTTLEIAERCDVSFPTDQSLMPLYPVPEGHDQASWFRKEVEDGLRRRYPAGVPSAVRERADFEAGVIIQMGFPAYFLVTADFINWAKARGIRVGPGRGSAAGSLVAYAMGITDLDPLEHGLLFERFLNPERVSMPDIDVDFDERRRGEVINYVTQRYGADRVAQIVTYSTIKAKQAVKDSSRVLGFPYAMGDTITKTMPPAVMGKDIPLSGIFDTEHPRYAEASEFRTLYEGNAEVQQVVDTARGLEGLKRQWSVHAAGVIMSSEPLIDHIPIMRREQDGATITQFDYPTCESLGLLKMDFLGLRNLTVIDDALRNIVSNGKEPLALEALTLDDPATYDLLARGDTLGVFQLDGGPMRSLLRLMRPDHFEDISAVLALYRPGPMGMNSHTNYALRKNGQQQIEPIHPELEEPLSEILSTTYGVIVYQEQVMAAAQKVAGYSLGKADLLRRAMGKKKKEILDKEYIPFAAGMAENGFSTASTEALWEVLVPFAGYAFNKAHSAGYGLVSYWTAYLKANYPAEYMAALLTSVRDDKDKSALYLNECRKMGINVLPPDVNESLADFAAVGRDIRFGLSAIRNVGGNVVAGIVAAREEQGRYTDFGDFMAKIPLGVCNKRVLESLIKAGAFDSFGHARRALLTIHEAAVDSAVDDKRNQAAGMFDLFGDMDEAEAPAFAITVPEMDDWEKSRKLALEREMLGLYVSDHPLRGVESVLAAAVTCGVGELGDRIGSEPRPRVTLGGLVSGVQRRLSKKGETWASFTLEDLAGSIEVMAFARTYAEFGQLLVDDAVVLVDGTVDRRDEALQVVAREIKVPNLVAPSDRPVVLTMSAQFLTPERVAKLKTVLQAHPGPSVVHIRLTHRGRITTIGLNPDLRVDPSSALYADLKSELGASCVIG